MRRRVLFLAAILGMVAMLAAAAPAYGQGRPLATTLTGAAEVPGPGDPDASGTAFITLNQGQGEVCFELSWVGIDGTVVAAHIHVGPPGLLGRWWSRCSRTLPCRVLTAPVAASRG